MILPSPYDHFEYHTNFWNSRKSPDFDVCEVETLCRRCSNSFMLPIYNALRLQPFLVFVPPKFPSSFGIVSRANYSQQEISPLSFGWSEEENRGHVPWHQLLLSHWLMCGWPPHFPPSMRESDLLTTQLADKNDNWLMTTAMPCSKIKHHIQSNMWRK